jgi:alkanesulfonate monooxygenase SsuD/methylene tetrahydromethanopterin reductase-like flavin-dependent oxidoreductase (luciferase family)
VKIGYGLDGDVTEDTVRAVALAAEELGYDSFWLNYPRSRPADGLAALCDTARTTNAIDVGVGVIPLTVCSAATALAYLAEHPVADDRLLLGLGSGDPGPGSLARVRDAVAEVRGASSCRVVVAALGEKMCRLAGEIADGVLFNFVSPVGARICAEWVEQGAERAGRERPELCSYVRFAIGPEAVATVEAGTANYFKRHAEHYARMQATPMNAAIAVRDGDEVRLRLDSWADALDTVVLRPLPAHADQATHLELVHAAARTPA